MADDKKALASSGQCAQQAVLVKRCVRLISALSLRIEVLRSSQETRTGLLNALCGVADYAAQPLGMLLAAPFFVHRLGLAQYGLWMLATAAIGSGGLLSTGFSDTAVKYIAMYRGHNDWLGITQVIRGAITINLILGGVVSILLWIAAPFAGQHLFRIQPDSQKIFVQALRIGCAILVVRSLDSILVSTLRAFEKYRPAVEITICARAMTILSGVVLVARGRGVVSIMVASLVVTAGGVLMQARAVRANLGPFSLWPSWNGDILSKISSFGCFSWLQALSGVVFTQADRLIVGICLGASAVAYYSVCIQVAMPIHGLVASGFHFLFPHLSARHSRVPIEELKPVVSTMLWLNVLAVSLLCLPVALFSKAILTAWMGPAFAQPVWVTLFVIAISFGLVGVNVTGHYTLLALGAVRYVTLINLAAGVATLGAIAILIPRFGLVGAAMGRLVYGPVTWVMYYKIHKLMTKRDTEKPAVKPVLAMVSEKAS